MRVLRVCAHEPFRRECPGRPSGTRPGRTLSLPVRCAGRGGDHAPHLRPGQQRGEGRAHGEAAARQVGSRRRLRERRPHALRDRRPPGAGPAGTTEYPRQSNPASAPINAPFPAAAAQMFFTTGKSARKRVSDNTLDLIQDRLKPHLRAGRYGDAISSGVKARRPSACAGPCGARALPAATRSAHPPGPPSAGHGGGSRRPHLGPERVPDLRRRRRGARPVGLRVEPPGGPPPRQLPGLPPEALKVRKPLSELRPRPPAASDEAPI